VTERVDNMQFNTCVSAMMEYLNAFSGSMPRRAYETLIRVLNPFAPHLTEEIWERLGYSEMLVLQPWPVYDAAKLVKSSVTISVSVNGKHRGAVDVPTDASESAVVAAARAVVEKFLTGEVVKTIVVPNRMVNFVIRG
jgi:leucyl-tRNA synthetase